MASEAKHTPTPAPWEREAGGKRGAWIKGSNGEWAALACGDTDSTAEANARLIAAAPDFYRAAMLRREYEALPVDRGGKNGPKGRARTAWIEAEEAAVAKTEGRSDA